MPVTAEYLDEDEIAATEADYPLLSGVQALDGADARWNEDGDWATADASATAGPAYYACDRATHRRTYPNAEETVWYLIFELADEHEPFDFISILLHTIDPDDVVDVNIEAADDGDFSTNLTPLIVDETDIHVNRHTFLLIGDDSTEQRFSTVAYLRIRIETSNPSAPEIGEVWCGRRRVFRESPRRPYDVLGRSSVMRQNDVNGRTDVAQAGDYGGDPGIAGRRSFRLATRTQHGDEFRSLNEESGYATMPVLVIQQPASFPHSAMPCTLDAPIKVATVADPECEELELPFTEIAPLLVEGT